MSPPDSQANGAPLLAADGSPQLPHIGYDADGYPFADDQPLAESSFQSDVLFYAYPALKSLAARRFPGAFAACDMLVHPYKGNLRASVAPDIFIAFDAGDYPRNSYKLWEGEPVPSFVLEALSGTTGDKDLGEKLDRYEAWGVAEYWVFDPFAKRVPSGVAGHALRRGAYVPIPPKPGTNVYPSAVLGVEFRPEGRHMRIRDTETGEDLRGYEEERVDQLAERRARIAAEAEVARLKALLAKK